jgi:hypothetical protein
MCVSHVIRVHFLHVKDSRTISRLLRSHPSSSAHIWNVNYDWSQRVIAYSFLDLRSTYTISHLINLPKVVSTQPRITDDYRTPALRQNSYLVGTAALLYLSRFEQLLGIVSGS